MRQPEGVTADSDGNIYVVGEPNQLLILTRKTPLNS
ncbi:SdiA-regulated domain-containing protein [Methylophaga sp. SB9B]